MNYWTLQIQTADGWRTDYVEAETRFDVIDAAIDAAIESGSPVENWLRFGTGRYLIRPAVYKEWMRNPPCGCPSCKK